MRTNAGWATRCGGNNKVSRKAASGEDLSAYGVKVWMCQCWEATRARATSCHRSANWVVKDCETARVIQSKGNSVQRLVDPVVRDLKHNVGARWPRTEAIINENDCNIPNNRKAKPNHLTPLETWGLVAGGKLCAWSETTVCKSRSRSFATKRKSSTNREELERAGDVIWRQWFKMQII